MLVKFSHKFLLIDETVKQRKLNPGSQSTKTNETFDYNVLCMKCFEINNMFLPSHTLRSHERLALISVIFGVYVPYVKMKGKFQDSEIRQRLTHFFS